MRDPAEMLAPAWLGDQGGGVDAIGILADVSCAIHPPLPSIHPSIHPTVLPSVHLFTASEARSGGAQVPVRAALRGACWEWG